MTSRQSAGEADRLVQRYLAQLDAALQGVDASRREEILAEVDEHIEQGRDGLDTDDPASIRTLLDQVGDPAAIAAEAGAPSPGSRRWDAWTPWLIIFGLVAALGGRRLALPLAAAVLLAVAGLAAHVLPPVHLMRTRRRQRFNLPRSAL